MVPCVPFRDGHGLTAAVASGAEKPAYCPLIRKRNRTETFCIRNFNPNLGIEGARGDPVCVAAELGRRRRVVVRSRGAVRRAPG